MNRNNDHAFSRAMRGFTMVEMAVVLVVIGVILGAIMIGRDGQRNAEYLRIRQTFVNQWAVAYNSYVQRTGVPIGDNAQAPRLMVNGRNFSGTGGGNLAGVTPPAAICEGERAPGMARDRQEGVSLRTLILQAGIELPQGRGVGMEDRYVYLDSNGNPQELQVCFQWNPPGTTSGTGNVMVITGLTPDLAQSLASAIKGNADASSGSFRQESVATGAGGASLAWTADNTQAFGSGAAPASGSGASEGQTTASNREAQVQTVVAHFKMNQ
ncbi:MAG: prepilin-type N-terminal cleavage/methylation domain-containing protein [Variovorax sp.]